MAISYWIFHAIRGRIRLRAPIAKSRSDVAKALLYFLQQQPGITNSRINRSCASVIVNYDPNCWTQVSLIQKIKDFFSPIITHQKDTSAQQSLPVNDSEKSGFELILSSTAIALGLIAGSLPVPILLPLLIGSAFSIFLRAFDSLTRRRKLNVDVLDASATTLLTLRGQLPTAALMVWLVNLADYIRFVTKERSRRAITELMDYQSRFAWVLRDGKKVRVTIDKLQVGETVVVYSGERIPVDGAVILGKATVDQHTLTGESMPVEKGVDDYVYASTVVSDGKLYLRAKHIGSKTEVAKIVQMVQSAPIRDTRAQNYAELWADRLVPYSFLGAGTSVFMTGNVNRAASLLIIDYGTGIRVAAPTTILSSMTKAARSGILIKGGRHIESLAEVDAIVFDKTGTLTTGTPQITDVIASSGYMTSDEVLALAAGAEQRLSHPVAEAVVRVAKAQRLSIPERADSDYHIGLGVEATIDGMTVLVGNFRFLTNKGIRIELCDRRILRDFEQQCTSPICVAVDGELKGMIGLADPIRPESAAVIEALRERKVRKIVMLTGDRPTVAKRVADALGITNYVADVFPEAKVEIVKNLQQEGHKVGVVGDGINDSPALAQADVGIAVNGGTDVAQETAHVVLLKGNLWKIPQAIDTARESTSLIRQNWQLIAIPNTAALGLSFIGVLGPVAATLISNGSTIAAAANALRLLMNGSKRVAAKPRRR